MDTQDLTAPHTQSAEEQQVVVDAQVELIKRYLAEQRGIDSVKSMLFSGRSST